MKSYKQIKDDLDDLRLLVEKSELWVYKAVKQEDKKVGSKFDCTETLQDFIVILMVLMSVCLPVYPYKYMRQTDSIIPARSACSLIL